MTSNNWLKEPWKKVVSGAGVLGIIVQVLGYISQAKNLLADPTIAVFAILAGFVLVAIYCFRILTSGFKVGNIKSFSFTATQRSLAGVLLLISVVITGATVYRLIVRPCPWQSQEFTGNEFGIIVVDFTEGVGKNFTPETEELANRTFQAIEDRLEVSTLSRKAKVYRVCEVVKDENDARKAGEKYNATLVVWGNVAEYSEGSFQPFFTLMRLPNWPVDITPLMFDVELNRVDANDLPTKISARATTIAAYVVGLIYLDDTAGAVNYDKALQEFTFAIDQTQKELDAGNLSEEQILAIKRTMAMLHVSRGRVYAAKGDETQALAEYDAAEEFDPNYGYIYIAKGNYYYAREEFEKAKQYYLLALEITEHPTAYYGIGCVEFYLGNLTASIAALEKAISLITEKQNDPSSVRLVLAVVLIQKGDYKFAVEQLSEILVSEKASEDLKTRARRILGSIPFSQGGATSTATVLVALSQTSTLLPIKPSGQPATSSSGQTVDPPPERTATKISTISPAETGTLFSTAINPPTGIPTQFPTKANTPTQIPTRFPTGTPGVPTSFPTVHPSAKQCQDGIDNDSDGFIDMLDPECANPQDNQERK